MASESSNVYASSCEVKSIGLWKAGEDNAQPYVNLLYMVSGFQYYEEITSPAYAATMVVVDNSENILSKMPIQGFEKVVVQVEHFGTEYEYNFRIANIVNRTTADRQSIYTLYLLSEEALYNEGIRVNKIELGTPSEIVSKVLKEYLSVDATGLDIEESQGRIKLLPTKKTPFALIRSLQSKTISKKAITPKTSEKSRSTPISTVKSDVGSDAQKASGTAGYLFFRTRKGFVYKSIDKLATVDEDNPVVGETFYYTPGKVDGAESLYKIQEIKYSNEMNMMKKLRDGAFSSIVSFFDINTGKYEEFVYSLSDTWNDMVHMGSQTNLPIGQATLSQYPSRVMSTIVNNENWYNGKDVPTNDPDSFLDYQKAYLSQSISRLGIMGNQQMTISLTGHLELCAGDRIEIRVPNQVPDKQREKEQWDPEQSGTFLIKKLNHQFTVSKRTVYTVLELIRDSYGIKEGESNVN